MKARRSTGTALVCGGAMAAVAAVVACGSSSNSGELIIAIDTNVELPKNIDNVELDVLEPATGGSWSTKFAYPDSVAKQLGVAYAQLPGTLGVNAGSSPGATIVVNLYGNLQHTRVFQRTLTTIVPSEGTSFLRLVLDGLCLGASSVGSDGKTATCNDGTACIAGACVDSYVDPTTLVSFSSTSAYTTTDAGSCFSLASCFQNAPAGTTAYVPVTKSGGDCTISVPLTVGGVVSDDLLNIGVPVPSELCSASPCVVPLDHVAPTQDPPLGWSRKDAATIRLPAGLCTPSVGSPTASVLVSSACVSKTEDNPLCGAWDRVTSPEPTADGGILTASLDGSTSGDAMLPPQGDGSAGESDGGEEIEDGGQMSGGDASTPMNDASIGGNDGGASAMCDAGNGSTKLCSVTDDAQAPIIVMGKSAGAGVR